MTPPSGNPYYDLVALPASEQVFGTATGVMPLGVHPRSVCEAFGIPCCVHAPSDHPMRSWPQLWRADTGVMERTCTHGIGHPDPDHMAYVTLVDPELAWQGGHGCDGCCRPAAKEAGH